MKKVMLFIASMLFAVSASAATLDLSLSELVNPGTGDANSGEIDPASGQWVSAGTQNYNGDGDYYTLTTTRDTGAYITGTFNPGGIEENVFSITDGTSPALTPTLSNTEPFFVMLLASKVYTIFVDTVINPGQYNFTIATPIPAALFLFAPALLGFFGLRRKAALAA